MYTIVREMLAVVAVTLSISATDPGVGVYPVICGAVTAGKDVPSVVVHGPYVPSAFCVRVNVFVTVVGGSRAVPLVFT